MLAPVCLFTYNRLSQTKETIDALKKNYLAPESNLFIFSDGPKDEASRHSVQAVREFLDSVEGFKSVKIIKSEKNNGLANSIISGVNEIINEYGKVIVVEDDLKTSRNFLNFLNQALDYYENNNSIISVSGHTLDLPSLKKYEKDFYLGYRASSWGWGTWFDRWNKVDWQVRDYGQFIYNPVKHYKFMRGGSDLPYMLWKQMNDRIDSWAIRWTYHQFKNNMLTVFPSQSKVLNIGFDNNATHTNNPSRFSTTLEAGEQKRFVFEAEVEIDKKLAKEFRNQFSVKKRLMGKIKNEF